MRLKSDALKGNIHHMLNIELDFRNVIFFIGPGKKSSEKLDIPLNYW